jgi:hypothetical protein
MKTEGLRVPAFRRLTMYRVGALLPWESSQGRIGRPSGSSL